MWVLPSFFELVSSIPTDPARVRSPVDVFDGRVVRRTVHPLFWCVRIVCPLVRWSGSAGDGLDLTLISGRTADAILNAPQLPNFPLKGIAIGNGWIDPREQYPGYVDFAYEHGLVTAGSKVRPRFLLPASSCLSCGLTRPLLVGARFHSKRTRSRRRSQPARPRLTSIPTWRRCRST